MQVRHCSATSSVTNHGFTQCYCYLITSNVDNFIYFCVRGTDPVYTYGIISTGAGRRPIGFYISFPQPKICPGDRYFLAHVWDKALACKCVWQSFILPKEPFWCQIWVLGASRPRGIASQPSPITTLSQKTPPTLLTVNWKSITKF